jgi:hypothetical protein
MERTLLVLALSVIGEKEKGDMGRHCQEGTSILGEEPDGS